MIRVRYSTAKLYLSAEGHAGAAEYGKDTVCAAASMLVCTAAELLRRSRREGRVRNVVILMESGAAALSAEPEKGYGESMRREMAAICGGFELLAERYPEYICADGK